MHFCYSYGDREVYLSPFVSWIKKKFETERKVGERKESSLSYLCATVTMWTTAAKNEMAIEKTREKELLTVFLKNNTQKNLIYIVFSFLLG